MANADVGTTKKLIIPKTYLPNVYEKIAQNAVIPTLMNQSPKLYNNEEMIFMDTKPKAQYVGEGAPKSSSDWGFSTKPMHKFKLQTTIRMTEETEFGDEDSSVELLDYVFDAMGESLGQGVDSGMIHAVDPFSGTVMEDAKKVAIAHIGNQITATGNLQADVDALPDSLIENFNVNGIALDTRFANMLRKERNPNTSARLYPDIPLTFGTVGNFEGLKAVVSANVSGRSLGIEDTGILAIMGAWDMAQWGIIRQMTLRKFDVGDPDGRGYDLAYKNEVAYRVEMLFAFGVAFNDAFAVLKAAGSSAAAAAAKASAK